MARFAFPLPLCHERDRRGVEVRVLDSGPGIPLELREQIFNPFFTTKKTGVGLGLSIVSKIIDEHRGSIEICDGDTAGDGLAGGKSGACFVSLRAAGGTGSHSRAPRGLESLSA